MVTKAVCLWDLRSGNLVRTIRDLEATVFSIAFSPDGEILVTSDAYGRVKVWSALIGHNQMLTSAEEAHDLGVNSICFSPIYSKGVLRTDYHLVTCGIDGFVCRWSIQTGNTKEMKLVTRRQAHDGSAMVVNISADGETIVTGGGDKVIKIWSQFLEPCQTLEGHSRYVTSLAFSPCGQILVSGSNDKSLRVWARSDTEHISFQNMASSCDSRAEKRFQVQLSKSQRRQLGSLSGHSLDVTSIDSRDSMIVSGCADSLVRVWRWSESEHNYAELTISPLVGHTYAVYSVKLDAGGKRLVSAGLDGRVIFWSLSSGDIIQSWTHPERLAFRVVTLSPDGAEIAAGCDDNNVYRWSLGQGEGTERISQWHDNTVQALAFSPASNLLACGCSGGALSIWSADSGVPLMTEVDGHDLGVTGLQFKLDGSLVSVGNDGAIKIWSLHPSGAVQCEAMVRAHHTSILSVWISSDQDILVTGSGDKTSKVWCMSSLACVATLGPHETYVTGAAGDRLTGALAVGVGRSIVLYRLPPIGAESSARGHDISNWSPAEVSHWLGTLGLSETCEKLSDVNGAQLRRLSLEELISFGIDEDTGRQICDEILMCDGSGEIPDEFVCPITCDIMTSPVRCSDGFVYEECAIKVGIKVKFECCCSDRYF